MVWPGVQALLAVPIAAHALFNRPLVVGPESVLTVEILPQSGGLGVLWCDGRRSHEMKEGESVTVTSNVQRVKIARLGEQPFTTRLVKKFALPINGWRKRRDQ